MKRYILALFAITLLFVSCGEKEQEIAVTSISVSPSNAELTIGGTVQLTATVQPSNATEKTIIWSSSNQSVATVNNNGMVTALSEGTSTVTVSCGGKSATCQVIVSKAIVEVTSISLNKEELALIKGQSETLVATVNPSDATDKTVSWDSSDKDVASVDANGKVTAVAGGTATISAKAGNYQTTCKVTVSVPVESITLDHDNVSLEEEQSVSLVATVMPEDATDKTVTWSSSDARFVTVDESGKVTAIKEGYAIITANAGNMNAHCHFYVKKKYIAVTSVTLDRTELALFTGQSETLTATVSPSDATDKKVTWSSSNTSVASVDDNGNVVAVSNGNASISATAGSIHVSCKVIVVDPDVSSNYIYYTSDNEEIVIPNNLDAFGARIVSNEYKDGRGVIMFDGDVTSIGEEAFLSCYRLTSIVIPGSVTSIGKQAFRECRRLVSIVIPSSVTSIDNSAFSHCSALPTIRIPASITKIGTGAFYGCNSLSSIVVPNSVTSLGAGAFSSCSGLISIELSNSITSIGNNTFNGCYRLASIEIPESVTSIGELAFSSCSGLTAIKIPSSEIGSSAFADCTGLTDVEILNSVTSIGGFVFNHCHGISSIVIPNSVTSIGWGAFADCSGLTSITFLATSPCKIVRYVFDGWYPIYVPAESVNAYKTAMYWDQYADRIQAIQ